MTLQLISLDLTHNKTLPNTQVHDKYGYEGKNLSPQLTWANAPSNTKSYAIICHDPDAPRPTGWYHWLIVNIPKNINSIPQGGHIEGALETITDFQEPGYGGAAPPAGHGVHRYNFTIYALDVEKIDVTKDTPPTEVENIVKDHALQHATITGLYEKK